MPSKCNAVDALDDRDVDRITPSKTSISYHEFTGSLDVDENAFNHNTTHFTLTRVPQMPGEDVPDSTDWLSTPLSGLTAVESALRCQVCKDFYNTPMITSCSHTFCSLCIRRALGVDSKCPMCRTPEQEMKLRSNWAMEEAVEAFVKLRPAALALAHKGSSSRISSPKRKAEDTNDSGPAPGTKRLRTSARLSKNRTEQSIGGLGAMMGEEEDEVEDLQEAPSPHDDDNLPEQSTGLVPCPSCQRRMKEWQVFKHLESCPGPIEPDHRRVEKETGSILSQAQRREKNLERLPALSYSMLKETALRKKMGELGLDNSGPRSSLEKRHKEWVTLWNANCDAARPKSRSKLMNDLHVWEKAQQYGTGSMGGGVGLSHQQPVVKNKDFDGAAWAAKHDSSFKDLIATARKSRQDAQKTTDGSSTTADRVLDPATPLDDLDREEMTIKLAQYRYGLSTLDQSKWEQLSRTELHMLGYITGSPPLPLPAALLPATVPQTVSGWESLTRSELIFYGSITGTIAKAIPGAPLPEPALKIPPPLASPASCMEPRQSSEFFAVEDEHKLPGPTPDWTQNSTLFEAIPSLGPAASLPELESSAASGSWQPDQ